MAKENFVDFMMTERGPVIMKSPVKFSVRPSDIMSFECMENGVYRPATLLTLRQTEVQYSDDENQVAAMNSYVVVKHSYDDVKKMLEGN